jgi:predicted nucleic acid-binding protein
MPRPGGYLLDTNIILALVRRNDLGLFLEAAYGVSALAHQFTVAVVTVGELYALANKLAWGAARRAAMVRQIAPFDVQNIDQRVIAAYAEIDATSDAIGRPMGKNDAWIAATARVLDATLLTTDRDFDHLHGPWIDRDWVDPASKPTP